jgi:hypothetical protein
VGVSERGLPPEQIDTSRPHPARMYDYWLGGRDNYEVDREAVESINAAAPTVREAVHANRAFMRRAVRAVVRDYGVRQIIDIGTGIPTSPNTHEIAQEVDPQTRVAYVDNDPIVGVHANARLRGIGETGFVLADVRKPESVLDHPVVKSLIDFGEPVALVMIAVLHFIGDQDDPWGIVATLRDALPSGSMFALSHGTADYVKSDTAEADRVYRTSTAALNLRPYREVVSFLDGFDLIEPGMVTVAEWRPDVEDEDPYRFGIYGAVGRKP